MLARRQLSLSMALCVGMVFVAGCGGKGSTKVSYQTPPFSPFKISFTMNQKGVWEVDVGIATPVGIFSISQEFGSRGDFTYIVLRDRAKGTDQVFKMGVTGYVDIHTVGEHKIRLQQEDNRWIIETETISGRLEFEVHPSSTAIARVDFGPSDPDIVVSTNRTIVIEYAGIFSSPRTVPLDSIASITLTRMSPHAPTLSFQWKEGATHDELADIAIGDSDHVDANFAALEQAISKVVDHVTFEQSTNWLGSICLWCFLIFLILGWCGAFLGK